MLNNFFFVSTLNSLLKKTNTCPIDRKPFNYIIVSNPLDKDFTEKKKIEDQTLENNEVTDFTYCEVCGACDREDTLLLCDGCDRGYHCECLNPPLHRVSCFKNNINAILYPKHLKTTPWYKL